MTRSKLRLLLTSFAVAALMGSATGCREWLDDGLSVADDALLIDFDLSLDLPGAITVPYPGSEQLNALPIDTASGIVKLPFVPTPALPINMIDIDPTGQLERFKNNIRSIKIKRITATVTDNSFPTEIQPIAIHIGEFNESVETSLRAAETPVIAIGTNPVVDATIDTGNQTPIGNILSLLAFSITTRTAVKKPAGAIPEGGSFTMKFKSDLTLTATPVPQ
jgi:hypothetical protein